MSVVCRLAQQKCPEARTTEFESGIRKTARNKKSSGQSIRQDPGMPQIPVYGACRQDHLKGGARVMSAEHEEMIIDRVADVEDTDDDAETEEVSAEDTSTTDTTAATAVACSAASAARAGCRSRGCRSRWRAQGLALRKLLGKR